MEKRKKFEVFWSIITNATPLNGKKNSNFLLIKSFWQKVN